MNGSIPPAERCIFEWNVKDFIFCLIQAKESLRSPIFQLQRSKTVWYLEIDICRINTKKYCILTRLCRSSMYGGPPEIKVRFSLYLKTLHGQKIWGNDYSLYFAPGSSCGSTCEHSFVSVPSILKNNDTLVVTCDMFLITDKPWNVVDPDLQLLSQDFERFENGEGNAKLVVGENKETIAAQRDILCDCSSVFRNFFRRGDNSEFHIPKYSPEVVKSMLAFLYFRDITKLVNDPAFFYILRCALEYDVSHLINILQPKWIYVTSQFELFSDKYEFIYTDFTKALNTCDYIHTGLVILKFQNIGFQATMYFNKDNKFRGHTVFYIEMWNLANVDSFIMEMSIIGDNAYTNINRLVPTRPESDGKCGFSVLIADELLFGNGNVLLLHDYLRVKFKFKFRLKQSHAKFVLKSFR